MTLSPTAWPTAERERWWHLEGQRKPGNPTATGRNGIVTTAHHALPARIGLEALKQGGSAADATAAAAMAQIVLGAGAVISFFGIFGLAYHVAASGEVATLSAGWKTCLGETDPLSIPGKMAGIRTAEEALITGGGSEPTGRAALVGGFFRALDAMLTRYGKLPRAEIFAPAIELAEDGFAVGEELDYYIALRGDDLRRLPETAAIFVRPDGALYSKGDHFRQIALAATLRGVAEYGSCWMYEGEWAKRAAQAVQRDGGTMTAEDIASYAVEWHAPITVSRGGYDIALLGGPEAGAGSTNLIEALHLADAAGIKAKGHWTRSPESFRDINLITNNIMLSGFPGIEAVPGFENISFDPEVRRTRSHADTLWQAINGAGSFMQPRAGGHSDTVTAIDQWGNIAALCHSSNCVCWGKTTIVVDGVSIVDSAAIQQPLVAAAGPGGYTVLPLEVGIMLKDGVGVSGFASKNMGLHQKTVQCVLNMTDFGMNAVDAANAPAVGLFAMDADDPTPQARVVEGDFDPALLAASGLSVHQAAKDDAWLAEGHWVPASRDPVTGELSATSPEHASGQAAAF
ncbi:gamma-glutamyltransferase [Sphingomonas sp.]|uniref:gamma-glutamyltransferase n=1 Tax=Sphingomonas sp. TaxID=28214 RepID=UPI003D6CE6B1